MKDHRWNWCLLLIVVVVGGAALPLYYQGLKPGIDLAGGHTLVYEVDVPPGEIVSQTIENTIETLKKRVDPNGVMNLVWRRLAGNRFEVQMPAAPKGVKRLRKEFIDARDALLATNISRGSVKRVLRRAPDDRGLYLKQLAGSDVEVEALLTTLADAHNEREAIQQVYDQAEKEKEQAQEDLDALGADATDQQSQQRQSEFDAKLKIAIDRAGELVAAKKKLESAWEDLVATNIHPAMLTAALEEPNRPGPRSKGQNKPTASKREVAVNRLKEKHPSRATGIDRVAAAYAEYENIKGPLDDPEDLKALLRGSGVLEFRIAPRADLSTADKYRQQLKEQGPRGEPTDPYRWLEIEDISAFADTKKEQNRLFADPALYFREYAGRDDQPGIIADRFAEKIYLLLGNRADSSITQDREGWKLTNARGGADSLGLPAVHFTLNAVGGQYMSKLTSTHRYEPMAIVLDDRVISAPTIQDTISANGIITSRGGYAPDERRYLVQTLNAGSLQARVSPNPIYQKSFDAAFGRDNLEAGLKAAVWALVVVAAFMVIYYLFLGLVADFALFANLVLILGVMSVLQATFTLPGIAAVVLTIGMAVDANVLIFERIREELGRGADLRPAVRAGYGKALGTIIDANLTTLIVCVVLGYTATAEVKGFAVTLGIGILATMFTALVGTRTWIELYLNVISAKSLPMLPSLVPAVSRLLHPNINWVGKRFSFLATSAALMIASVALIYQRGEDMLDIEFRSGTEISFALANGKTMDLREVKQRLTDEAKRSAIEELSGHLAKVVISGEHEGTGGNAFTVATLADNTDNRVSRAITAAFAHVLDVKRAIAFRGDQAESIRDTPAHPITPQWFDDNVDRPELPQEVLDYFGGVAILVEKMVPATTIEDIKQRIERVRLQPPHHKYGYRQYRVFGLELASAAGSSAPAGDRGLLYESVLIVTRDNSTNYVEAPDSFTDRGGLAATEWAVVRDALTRDTSLGFVSNISPQISTTMRVNAIGAICLSLLAVVAYIWLRFGSLRYGLAAIVALVHDVVIAGGIVAVAGVLANWPIGRALLLTEFKMDLSMVAAFLTIVGYSLNDTIVVFDRIRENRGRLAFATPPIVNDSVNQTISRTVLTSLTTALALLTLYRFGGDGVHGFAFTMLVGVVVGTYSSIAIAAPIVLLGKSKEEEASA